jgi:hypothetical protein
MRVFSAVIVQTDKDEPISVNLTLKDLDFGVTTPPESGYHWEISDAQWPGEPRHRRVEMAECLSYLRWLLNNLPDEDESLPLLGTGCRLVRVKSDRLQRARNS